MVRLLLRRLLEPEHRNRGAVPLVKKFHPGIVLAVTNSFPLPGPSQTRFPVGQWVKKFPGVARFPER